MDHKVSKDMISSGMTPSGEKTQADLGRTQYGSAPSPSRLMDAYKSMYQNQEKENLDEMKMPPKKINKVINPNTQGADLLKKRISGEMTADQVDKEIVKSRGKAPTKEPSLPKFKKTDNPSFKKPESKSMVDTVRDRRQEVVSDRREKAQKIMSKYGESVDLLAAYRSIYEHHQKDKDGNTIPHEDDVKEGKIPAGLQAYLDKKKGKKKDEKEVKESIDLFDVISVKLIEEGYSEKESYEIMANLTDEQLEEINEAIISGTLATLGALGGMLAKGGAAAAAAGKATLGAAKVGAMKAAKVGMTAGKKAVMGTKNLANKAMTKVQNIAKPSTPTSSPKITSSGGKIEQGGNQPKNKILSTDNLMKAQLASSMLSGGGGQKKQTAGRASAAQESSDLFDFIKGQLLDEGYSEKEAYAKMSNLTEEQLDEFITALTKKVATRAAQYGANLGQKTKIDAVGGIKRKPFEPVVQRKPFDAKPTPKPGEQGFKAKSPSDVISSVHASRRKPEPTTQKKEEPKVTPIPIRRRKGQVEQENADLFDIVKGQLLDEGLSEEEIRDIMLALTPEEIMNEMAVNPKIAAMDAKNKADMIARAKSKEVPQNIKDASKRQMKAGTPREDPNNPYTTQDKKDIINYNKNK